MRVMVFVKATEDSERNGFDPNDSWTQEMMAAMGQFNEELKAAGILVDAGGLLPSTNAMRVAFDGSRRTVTGGPFANPRELVAGFWIWNVESIESAVAWAKRCPNPMRGPSEIEIRPFHELGNPTRSV